MENPIEQVEPSLDELFARDPLDLTGKDIETIVSALRAQRSRFVIEEKTGGTKKANKKATAEELKGVDISALDIEL